MRASSVVAILACTVAHGSVSILTFDEVEAKNRPVAKVVNLLNDMKTQLEKEAEEDQEVYEKMVCWCSTNKDEKTKAIADAEARIADLGQSIEQFTGDSGRLSSDIRQHESEEAENRDSLDKATALREKQLNEFNAEEKDLLESISSLKAATTILGKHQEGSSMIQLPQGTVVKGIESALEKHSEMLKEVLSPSDRQTVQSFVQAQYFPGGQSYAPQSGQIFGILSQMKETFENNLASSQKDEMANQKSFEDLKGEKTEQISEARSSIDSKSVKLAETNEANAQAKVDVKDTKNTLAADQEFLAMVQDKCAQMDAEWGERSKTRQLEIEAVSKALAFLSSDEAKDLFSKNFNAAFIQRKRTISFARREQLFKFVQAKALALKSKNLAALAMKVKQNDVFAKILAYIQTMIKKLQQAQLDDIKQKDFCYDELRENELKLDAKRREKKASIATIEDLHANIDSWSKEIEKLTTELREAETQMTRAGENREIENKEFQEVINDQRATQALLQKALDVLKGFYERGASMLQSSQPAFKERKDNASGGGVIGMIQQIIDDAATLEKDAIRDEDDAQKAYEAFVKETNTDKDAKTRSIVELREQRAEAEQALSDAKVDDTAIDGGLKDLMAQNNTLHGSCDFLVKNFEIRQEARQEEMEAFKSAQAYLQGMGV